MLEGGVVELSELGRMAEASQNVMSLFEYVLKRANERIVKDSTRKRYMVFLNTLKEYGQISYFSDLTEGSVRHFDEWLHRRYGSQNTIRDYHKHMKEFVNDAMRDGLLKSDPYLRFKVKRGRPASDKFISPEEVAKIESLDLRQQSLKDARDLFLLQCYTGIAYADLVSFEPSKIVDGLYINKREKTGVEFYAPIKDKALSIIKRMAPDGVWPKIPCNQKYNEHLKLIASYARIDKPLSSHWARRTAGNWMVNEGMSMETVQKVLGHASIRQTEEVYAHLNEDSCLTRPLSGMTSCGRRRWEPISTRGLKPSRTSAFRLPTPTRMPTRRRCSASIPNSETQSSTLRRWVSLPMLRSIMHEEHCLYLR